MPVWYRYEETNAQRRAGVLKLVNQMHPRPTGRRTDHNSLQLSWPPPHLAGAGSTQLAFPTKHHQVCKHNFHIMISTADLLPTATTTTHILMTTLTLTQTQVGPASSDLSFLQSHTPSLKKFLPALKLTNCTLPKLKSLGSLPPAMLNELWLGIFCCQCNKHCLLLELAAIDVNGDNDHKMVSGRAKGKGQEDMYCNKNLGGSPVAPDNTEGVLLIGHLKAWIGHC